MRAAIYGGYGPPDAVSLTEVPIPQPPAGQLRIRIAAAAVNPLDWKLVRGDFRLVRNRRWPKFLGTDFSGTVDHLGPGVSGWTVGEAVFGSISTPLKGDRGSFADYVAVTPEEITRRPSQVSFEAAAALPIAGASALECLDLAQVKAGAEVLIVGATGGVGSYCTAAARARQARVTAVCRSAHEAYARQLGAAMVVAYDRTDPLQLDQQFDAIIDVVGQHSFAKWSRRLKPSGVYVLTVPGPFFYLQALKARLLGREKAHGLMIRITPAHLARLAELAGASTFAGVSLHAMPLTEVQRALERSRSGGTPGKLVLNVSPN